MLERLLPFPRYPALEWAFSLPHSSESWNPASSVPPSLALLVIARSPVSNGTTKQSQFTSVPHPSGPVEKAVGIVIASPASGRRNLSACCEAVRSRRRSAKRFTPRDDESGFFNKPVRVGKTASPNLYSFHSRRNRPLVQYTSNGEQLLYKSA